MNIQRLEPSHAPAYRALMLEAYTLHPDAFTSTAAERAALPFSWWEGRLREGPQPAVLVLGALDNQHLAGVVGLSFESREKVRHRATLFGLYVPPQARGRGLGAALVRAALSEARLRRGIRVVRLTVTHRNRAARALYERCGFVPFGLEPLAVLVGNEFISKVHMWCNIEPKQDAAPA